MSRQPEYSVWRIRWAGFLMASPISIITSYSTMLMMIWRTSCYGYGSDSPHCQWAQIVQSHSQDGAICSPPCNSCFLGPMWVCPTNSTFIGSSVFPQLTVVPNTQTTLRVTSVAVACIYHWCWQCGLIIAVVVRVVAVLIVVVVVV